MATADTPLRRLLTSLIAPATVSTAVLYYFGWLRSQTIAGRFGYDASLLGLSTQDYILRSVQPVGTLAVVGGLLAWPAVVWHRWLADRRRNGRLARWADGRFTNTLLAVGLTAMVVALVWTWVGFATAGYPLPILCRLAAVGIGYGSWLRGAGDTRLAPEVGGPSPCCRWPGCSSSPRSTPGRPVSTRPDATSSGTVRPPSSP